MGGAGGKSPSLGFCAALGFSLVGGLLLVASAFVPAYGVPSHFAIANTLWRLSDGWSIAAGGVLIVVLALRAFSRRRCSWAGLWVGAIAVLLAIRLATSTHLCNHLFVCVNAPAGLGIYLLAVGGVFSVIGWAIALLTIRAQIHAPTGAPAGRPPVPLREAPVALSPSAGRGVGVTLRSPIVWSLGVYTVLSVGLLGTQVLGHFGSMIIAQNDFDPSAYMWFFAWWPHAVLHGVNPFITQALFVPDGYNLTWATSVPAASLVLAPVTAAFGPVVTWNVFALIAPALSAWTAFLLCVHITRAVTPSLLGGFIFGFSPYMARMLGAPNLSLVALVPLLVLLVLRRVQGSLGERRFLILMALALAFQGLTGVEVLATVTVFGAIALLAGFGLFVDYRPALARTVRLLLAAYAAAGVLVSPMLFMMAFRPHTVPTQAVSAFAVDLLSWFRAGSELVPVAGHGVGGVHGPLAGPAYLGLPLVIIVLVYAWQNWRSRSARLVLVCLIVPAVASLGGRLIVDGKYTAVGLPWAVLGRLPGLERAIPQRFAVFAFLAAAVIVAMWLASRGGRARWALALIAVAFVTVNTTSATWKYPVSMPSFFATGLHRAYLHANDRVLVVPNIGGMRWQAQADFSFQLAGGYVGATPTSYTRYRAFGTAMGRSSSAQDQDQLRRFVVSKGVTVIVVDKRDAVAPTLRLLGGLGVAPRDIGGTLVYRLRAP